MFHHRETTARPLAAKHEVSNPKSEADVESSRDATFLSVVGADGNREKVRKLFQATRDSFFAAVRPFCEQERAPDTASDAVIPASYGDIDQIGAGHCHGWASGGDRPGLSKLVGRVNTAMRVLAILAIASVEMPAVMSPTMAPEELIP